MAPHTTEQAMVPVYWLDYASDFLLCKSQPLQVMAKLTSYDCG